MLQVFAMVMSSSLFRTKVIRQATLIGTIWVTLAIVLTSHVSGAQSIANVLPKEHISQISGRDLNWEEIDHWGMRVMRLRERAIQQSGLNVYLDPITVDPPEAEEALKSLLSALDQGAVFTGRGFIEIHISGSELTNFDPVDRVIQINYTEQVSYIVDGIKDAQSRHRDVQEILKETRQALGEVEVELDVDVAGEAALGLLHLQDLNSQIKLRESGINKVALRLYNSSVSGDGTLYLSVHDSLEEWLESIRPDTGTVEFKSPMYWNWGPLKSICGRLLSSLKAQSPQ